jgi:hypothetical protein
MTQLNFEKSNLIQITNKIGPQINLDVSYAGPPLWSSGQSFWLQIRKLGFDSRHYQKKK